MNKIKVIKVEVGWWVDGFICIVCKRHGFDIKYDVEDADGYDGTKEHSYYGACCSERCAEMLVFQNI